MSHILIDAAKCNRDGICAEVCPRRLINFEKDNTPVPIAKAAEMCINCGHCTAACPAGALSLSGMNQDKLDIVDKSLLPTSEQVDLFLKSRRSVRVYQNKPVEREVMERLLETCRYAPTGSNSQSASWIIVENPEKLKELAGFVVDWMRRSVAAQEELAQKMSLAAVVESWDRGEDRIFRGAPAVVLNHGPRVGSMPRENSIIALTFFDLAAFSNGLGTCWAGYLMAAASLYEPLKKALGAPEENQVYGAMMIGYPKYRYRSIPERSPARVSWI